MYLGLNANTLKCSHLPFIPGLLEKGAHVPANMGLSACHKEGGKTASSYQPFRKTGMTGHLSLNGHTVGMSHSCIHSHTHATNIYQVPKGRQVLGCMLQTEQPITPSKFLPSKSLYFNRGDRRLASKHTYE